MRKELISAHQWVCIIVLFLFGSSVVFGINTETEHDSWIACIIAIVMAAPILLVYARITKLFPEKNIYDISLELFGKIFGRIIIAIITFYCIHLGALVIRNFSDFVDILALVKTPEVVLMILMIIVTTYLAKSGIETLAKWAAIVLPIVVFMVAFTVIIAYPNFEPRNLLPFMEHSFTSILSSSFDIVTFPFGEVILFLALLRSKKKEDNPYKILLYSLLIGGIICFVIIIRNTLTLGGAMKNTFFPSYIVSRIFSIGDFWTRTEGIISINFILAGITKITVCIIAASQGTAKLFSLQDYKKVITPVSLLTLTISAFLYKTIMEMFEFIKYYKYYAIPFQIIIPLIIWLLAEYKCKKAKNNLQNATAK